MVRRARRGPLEVRRRPAVLAWLPAALTLAALALPARAQAADSGAAALVEKEFSAAIRALSPATVFCLAREDRGPSPGSSGVLVTKTGYVLSDGDAGAYFKPVKGPGGKPVPEKVYADEVEIRIPDLKKGTYGVYLAKIVRRVAAIDSTLLKITSPPPGGFPFVSPSTADRLDVGAYTFAMGMAFGRNDQGTGTLTAGIVSSLVPAAEADGIGRWLELYTSAAVNPGVNGGPLVDADGALVGIISSWGSPEPDNPFQFLGKAFPIDRIRKAYLDLPDAATVFPDPKTLPVRSKQTELLERAFGLAARKAGASVVSLEIARSEPFLMRVPQVQDPKQGLKRYAGPVSGVLVSTDGLIVSSLYSFANTEPLVWPGFPNDIVDTFAKITGVTAHFPDGSSLPARIVAHDQRVGLVCLKVEAPATSGWVPIEAAPPESATVGRLVLLVGNPFGAKRNPNPLLTVGMYSRLHAADDEKAFRGDFQTDAGMTDGNVGGALVDVRGRVLGLATLWDPAATGRNSGIGFGIPWARVLAVLPDLQAGRSVKFGSGFLGVTWSQVDGGGGVRIDSLQPGAPAEKAGLKVGDVVVGIDDRPISRMFQAQEGIRTREVGDKVKIVVLRGQITRLEFTIELGKRT